jgi:hypothetical protein
MTVKRNIKLDMDNLTCGMNAGQPNITYEGKYFFTSEERGKGDIYLVFAKIIKELRPKELK